MSVKQQFHVLNRESKCKLILNEIFSGFIEWMDDQVLNLAKKDAELCTKGLAFIIKTSTTEFFVPINKDNWDRYEGGCRYLDSSLWKDAENLNKFFVQAIADINYINQWLSVAIVSDPENTKKRLPNFLAKMDPTYKNIPLTFCEIPNGKEAIWEKGEQLAKHYLGYKLLL